MPLNDHDLLIAIKTSVEYIKANMVTQDQCDAKRAKNGFDRSTKALDTTTARLWAVALIIVSVGVSALVAHLIN